VRKSYVQYLLRRAGADNSLAFGFNDAQGKLAWDRGENHFTLTMLDGRSDLDRSSGIATLGVNAILDGRSHTSIAQLGHRWTPVDDTIIQSRFTWLRERATNTNLRTQPLNDTLYQEWIAQSDMQSGFGTSVPFAMGFSFRRQRDEGFLGRYRFTPATLLTRNDWRAHALRAGGYLQQGWQWRRVSFTAGSRFDGSSTPQPRTVSPHASFRAELPARLRLNAAWSHNVQYQPLSWLNATGFGNAALPPARAIHLVAGLEREWDSRLRLRVEAWQRDDRDLATQPLLDPRLLPNGQIFAPPNLPPFAASLRGRGRGMEVFLQRRSANRWNGWLSYGYARTIMRDSIAGLRYAADFDQRHTVNAYASYRLSSQWNLSLRHSYGSNFPVPAFVERRGEQWFLSRNRNSERLPSYQRSDVRLNKSIVRPAWTGVLFLEVINAWNRRNQIFDNFNGFNGRTSQANLAFTSLFPILPAAGLSVDWGR
jgi:hypothetical protein